MNTNIFFNNLNEKQIEAVRYTEGYVRVVAGAGSGKTRVLSNRYAYIVECLGINPSNILCVTFTNRAAREMKSRIKGLLSKVPINDFICTYHGFCVRVLREDINKVYYPKSFTIADIEDQKSMLKEVYENLNITSRDLTYKKALKIIGEFKSIYPYIEKIIIKPDFKKVLDKDQAKIEQNIPYEFIRIQKKYFALDFQDLIFLTDYIFNKYNDVQSKWSSRIHYIMVDETQDNSIMQWELLNKLSQTHKNIFVVGDPDQSIYEWRHAVPDYLVNLEQKYSPLKSIVLDQNYRSTSQILDVANNLIIHNKNRIKKDMHTKKSDSSKIIYFHAKSEKEESRWVINKIQNFIKKGLHLDDFAILYRANYISRSFEQALIETKIPYVIYGGIRFFERKEVKDALSYLKLVSQNDDLAFLRIVNTPKRKLGNIFISKVKDYANKENSSLFEAMKNHITELDNTSAKLFISLIEEHREMIGSCIISDLLQSILNKSGLLHTIKLDGDDARIDNINELLQSIKMYEEENENEEDLSLISYLQDISLYTNIDYRNDGNFIKLMTIHQSKGLEFKIVFVVGMSEGILPSHRSLRERKMKALEEERRLAYVAFTRAEQELYITESEGFSRQTGIKYPSRFIFEIKKNLLCYEGDLEQDLITQAQNMVSSFDNENIHGIKVLQFNINDIVYHPVFGKGKIVNKNTDSDPHYDIHFETSNKTKPILLDFPLLEKFLEQDEPSLPEDKTIQIDDPKTITQSSHRKENHFPIVCPYCNQTIQIDIQNLPRKDKKINQRCDYCNHVFELGIPQQFYFCEGCKQVFDTIYRKYNHRETCDEARKISFFCNYCNTEFILNAAERKQFADNGILSTECPRCKKMNKISLE